MLGLGIEYFHMVNRYGKMEKEKAGEGVLIEVFSGNEETYGSAIIINKDSFLEEVALDMVKVLPNSLRAATPEDININ